MSVIAVDCMGGDNAPEAVIRGIALGDIRGSRYLLYGNSQILQPLCEQLLNDVNYEISHSDEAVGPDVGVMAALRGFRNTSMGHAISAVKEGNADAVVSCGNTAVYMAGAKIMLRTMDGIDRPALAALIPHMSGVSIALDLGANAEHTSRNLIEFALMGMALYSSFTGITDPSVALMNVASEELKGTAAVKEAAEWLRERVPSYVGYAEGGDLVSGAYNVLVSDGFSGNIALKAMEGTAKLLSTALKKAVSSNFLTSICGLGMKHALKREFGVFDPRKHNGAIMVGLRGVVVKSHGNSDDVAFANALSFTQKIVDDGLLAKISSRLQTREDVCS